MSSWSLRCFEQAAISSSISETERMLRKSRIGQPCLIGKQASKQAQHLLDFDNLLLCVEVDEETAGRIEGSDTVRER